MAGAAASILWAHRVYEEINARELSGHWPGPFKILLRLCCVEYTQSCVSKSIVSSFYLFPFLFLFSRRDSRVPIDLINDP